MLCERDELLSYNTLSQIFTSCVLIYQLRQTQKQSNQVYVPGRPGGLVV